MLRNASAPYPVMVRVTQCVGVGGMGSYQVLRSTDTGDPCLLHWHVS